MIAMNYNVEILRDSPNKHHLHYSCSLLFAFLSALCASAVKIKL